MPGKLRSSLLETVIRRTGVTDPAVKQGPAIGEDAAAIAVGDETLVVSSDPISLAAENVGTLGVYVACNDIAVAGVDPRWLTAVLLLPDEGALDPVVQDIDAAARDVGAAVVGGHTEYVEELSRPIVSLTAMGVGEFLPTSGATPGDSVILTKGAGIEGTAILAADFGDELEVSDATVTEGKQLLAAVSVVPDARALRPYASAMHDPTEGGVAGALQEMAQAAGVRIDISRDAVPIRPETRALTDAAGVDPLRIFGSGAVAATVPPDATADALSALSSVGIAARCIGDVQNGNAELRIDGESIPPVTDELYPLWEEYDSES